MAPCLGAQVDRRKLVARKSINKSDKGCEACHGGHGRLVAPILKEHEESAKGNVPGRLGVDERLSL